MEKRVRFVRVGERMVLGEHPAEMHEHLARRAGLRVVGKSPCLSLDGEFEDDEIDMGFAHESLGLYGSSGTFDIPRGARINEEDRHPARRRSLELWAKRETGFRSDIQSTDRRE